MANVQTIVYNQERDGRLSANQLYIFHNGKYFKLSDLKFATKEDLESATGGTLTKDKMRSVSSVAQYENVKNLEGVKFYLPPEYNTTEYVNLADNSTYYPASIIEEITENESIDLTKSFAEGEDSGEWGNLVSGMKRTISFETKPWSTNDAYVVVKLHGETNVRLVKKSDLVRFNNYSEEISLDDDSLPLEETPINIKGGNLSVQEIYTDHEYEIESLLSYESLDTQNFKEITHELTSTGSYRVSGEKSVPRYFSVQTPVVVSEADPRNEGKTHSVHKIKATNYELSASGTSLIVKPKFASAEIIVDKQNLFLDEACTISIAEIPAKDLVGKPIFAEIKEGENSTVIEIENLDMRQASLTYAPIVSLQETEKTEDILAENAYLKLADGTPVLESDLVKPIAYNFVEDQNTSDFDSVVVIGDDGKTYVLHKDAFSKSTVVEHKVGDAKILLRKEKSLKVKRTYDLTNAAVLQTTSVQPESDSSAYRKAVNSCKLIRTIDIGKFRELEIGNVEEIQQQAQEEVEGLYKQGAYNLPSKVSVNGEEREFGSQPHKRYVSTSSVYMTDYAHDALSSYSCRPVQYNEEKGEIELLGGPQFSASKATKKYLGKIGNFCGQGISMMSDGGIFGLAGIGVVLTMSLAALAITPAIALINPIRALVKNRSNKKLKNKTEINQPEWSEEVESLLAKELERVKGLEDGKTLSAEGISAIFQNIKTRIAMQGNSTFEAEFAFNDGVAEVNEDNMAAAQNFKDNVQHLVSRRNELTKSLELVEKDLEKYGSKKKTRRTEKIIGEKLALQSQLRERISKIEFKISGYLSAQHNGVAFNASPECEILQGKANNLQTFMMLKCCGLPESEEVSLTEEEISMIDYSLEEDKFYLVADGIREELDLKSSSKFAKGVNLVMQGVVSAKDEETVSETAVVEEEVEPVVEEIEPEGRPAAEEIEPEVAPAPTASKGETIELPESWDGKFKKDSVVTLLDIAEKYLSKKNISNRSEVKEFIQNNIGLFETAVNKRDKYKYLTGKIGMIVEVNNHLVKEGFIAKTIAYEMNERVTMEETQIEEKQI